MRQLIVGLGDGAIHSIKPQTGQKLWSFVAAKRAINTGVVVKGNSVIVSHGDENMENVAAPELGMIAAIDGSQTGDIKTTQWAVKGVEMGYSSPLLDGESRVPDRQQLSLESLRRFNGQGTLGTVAGFIAEGSSGSGRRQDLRRDRQRRVLHRPAAAGSWRGLSKVEMPLSKNSCCGSEGTSEQIYAGVAVSRGRVFMVSSDAVYALGPRQPTTCSGFAVDEPGCAPQARRRTCRSFPRNSVLKPGQKVAFKARLFDGQGIFLREEPATWSLDGLKGTIGNDGVLLFRDDPEGQAGLIKATVNGVTGEARARVAHALPWKEPFTSFADGALPPGWVNAQAGKLISRNIGRTEGTSEGSRRHRS